jgi:hypothetical protein
MIGRFTEITIHATNLALSIELLSWVRHDAERFAETRDEVLRLLELVNLDDFEIPHEPDSFIAIADHIGPRIARRLGDFRSNLLGDTTAMPFFILANRSYHCAALSILGKDWSGSRGLICDCLEDLGLDRELITVLDRELEWDAEGESEQVRAIRAGARFNDSVIRTWATKQQLSLQSMKLADLLVQLHQKVYVSGDLHVGRIESMTQVRTIDIGDYNTISAPIVIADSIENSFNALKEATVEDDIRLLLEELLKAINEANRQVPEDKSGVAEAMVRDAESLVREVTASKPRRKWYEISFEGLKQAAVNIGELADPVLDIVKKLMPLLLG